MARATNYDELVDKLQLVFATPQEAVGSFRPRASDVIISPFAKCGTTWLQQIVHGMRTGGDMDFEEVYQVVPWIEVAIDIGLDLDLDQRAEPRAFKSHLGWDELPRGCRYLVSFRDPKDAIVSLYRFMDGWFIEPGSIPIDEYVARRALDRTTGPDYWRHMASWLRHRDDPSVHLLTFEEMKRDRRGVVERISGFIGIDAGDPRIDVAVEQSSLEFMAAHQGPFSDPWLRARGERVAGIPRDSESSKVRRGEVGGHRDELSPETIAAMDRIWGETIGAEFGYRTYEDLDRDISAT